MNRLISFLSSGRTWILLLVLCIGARLWHEAWFLKMDSDYGVQLEAAKNFLRGNGLSNAITDAGDLTGVQYAPLTKWPVFFPLILAMVQWITHNWFVTVWIVQSCSILFLLLAFIRLLKFFAVAQWLQSFFVLFFIFHAAIPYYWSATDILTTALFIFGIPYFLRAVNGENKTAFPWILLGILSGVNALIRFACIPNLVIFPFALFLLGTLRKDGRLVKGGLTVMVISFFITAAFYFVFPIGGGRTGFLSTLMSFDLHWEHLKWFDPFPVKSFFYLSPVEYRLPGSQPALITLWRLMLHLASFLLCLVLFLKFFRTDKIHKYIRGNGSALQNATASFWILFLVAAAVIIGFLALESLATEPEMDSFGPPWMPPFWTFVYSHRYYSFLIAIIIVLVFLAIDRSGVNLRLRNGLIVFVGSSILYSFGFFVFTQYQILSPGGNGGGNFWVNYKEDIATFKLIESIANEEKVPVVYASFELKNAYPLPVVSSADPSRDYQKLILSGGGAAQGTCLIIEMPLESALDKNEQAFIAGRGLQKVLNFKESTVYRKNF